MTLSSPGGPAPGARTASMTPIGVERMGDAADALRDPSVLRLENLDTDLLPPREALAATHAAVDDDHANSYLPFFGHDRLRQAAARLVERTGGYAGGSIDWRRQCFISAGAEYQKTGCIHTTRRACSSAFCSATTSMSKSVYSS